jgi:hypothetical protein
MQWRQQQVPLQYLLHRVTQWFTGEPANGRRRPERPRESGAEAATAEHVRPAE